MADDSNTYPSDWLTPAQRAAVEAARPTEAAMLLLDGLSDDEILKVLNATLAKRKKD